MSNQVRGKFVPVADVVKEIGETEEYYIKAILDGAMAGVKKDGVWTVLLATDDGDPIEIVTGPVQVTDFQIISDGRLFRFGAIMAIGGIFGLALLSGFISVMSIIVLQIIGMGVS